MMMLISSLIHSIPLMCVLVGHTAMFESGMSYMKFDICENMETGIPFSFSSFFHTLSVRLRIHDGKSMNLSFCVRV